MKDGTWEDSVSQTSKDVDTLPCKDHIIRLLVSNEVLQGGKSPGNDGDYCSVMLNYDKKEKVEERASGKSREVLFRDVGCFPKLAFCLENRLRFLP